jgi:hypothetical protein
MKVFLGPRVCPVHEMRASGFKWQGSSGMSTVRARDHEMFEAKKATVFSILNKATHNDEQDLAGQCPCCIA